MGSTSKTTALLTLSFTVGIAILGCVSQDDGENDSTSPPTTQSDAGDLVEKSRRAFENDCYSLCDLIVRSVRQGNAERITERTDKEQFYDRVLKSVDLDEQTRDRLREWMTLSNPPGPDAGFATLVDDVAQGMRLEPVRLTVEEDSARALLRTRFPDGRFNYLECLFAPDEQGRAVLVDASSLDAGGSAAETLGLGLTDMFGADGPGADLAAVASRLAQQNDAWKSGHLRDSEAFDAAVEDFPAEYRESRRTILMQIRSAETSPQRYARHVARFADLYPEDRSLPILNARACMLTGEYAQAFDFLDAVDRQIGGDPFLNLIRAECSAGLKDFDGVRRYARKAVADDPALSAGYVALMHAEVAGGRYDEAIAWAERFLECGDGTTRELALVLNSDDSALRRFRDSREYREWAKLRIASP